MSMNAIKASIIARLKAHAEVSAIVGDRVYPLGAPRTARLPRVIVRVSTDTRTQELTRHTNQRKADVEIFGHASTDREVSALAEALDSALDDYGTEADGDPEIRSCRQQSETEDLVYPGDNSDEVIFQRTLRYLIDYRTTRERS